jgi:uncharacterized protein (DUF1330 family)
MAPDGHRHLSDNRVAFSRGQAFCLPESCLKNGDAPKSPLQSIGSLVPSVGIIHKAKFKPQRAYVARRLRGAACSDNIREKYMAPVYLVIEIDVTDPEAYGKEFVPRALKSMEAAGGGRRIASGGVGGAGAKGLTAITGVAPKRASIQQWDSMDKLKDWYFGEAYQEALKIGEKYATFRGYVIDGTE